ncbi:MAG: hypothetical protein AAGA87_10175 [Pseudomonadota bacterium]
MKPVVIGAFAGTALLAAPAFGATLQALYSDQSTDQVIFAVDRNGDGDADDAGETQVFFDEFNESGLATPSDNVFTMVQASDGAVFIGDGNADAVYRLKDLDGDDSAQSVGEASVWFSADNAGLLPLLTPNGVAQGGDGAIYIVEADTVSTPNGDFVYRTEDLNGDGDANDAGEAAVWLDLKALNAASSAFDIRFDGDVAYIADSAGGDPRIYRAEDVNGDGTVSGNEVTEFISGAGAPFAFGLDVLGGTVYALDLGGQVFSLTDLDASGSIDAAGESAVVWDEDLTGATAGALFSIAALSDDELLFTSNGGTSSDALFRLLDLNGDGDFLDAGETTRFLSRDVQGMLPDRPRAIIGYDSVAPVPVPPALPALATALGLLWLRRRR